MGRVEESQLTYLDTHVVAWLYGGLVERLSQVAWEAIEGGRLIVSGMVELELQYLHEIGRILPGPSQIFGDLFGRIGLMRSESVLAEVAARACEIEWTRDPFDRMIAAETLLAKARLVTKDKTMRDNCSAAVW